MGKEKKKTRNGKREKGMGKEMGKERKKNVKSKNKWKGVKESEKK